MSASNLELARYNMIEQQVRPWDVLDQRVLDAMQSVPREAFVPEGHEGHAFADVEIPLGFGEVMMKPILEGRMMQSLNIKDSDEILEIGTGSGYLTACLARLGHHVYSVEIEPELVSRARATLEARHVVNATVTEGDGSEDWVGHMHYDAIVITGAMPSVPDAYKQRLAIGGRLLVVVGQSPDMQALRITRVAEDAWTTESLFDTELLPLRNVATPSTFTF